ncbi:phenylalanine--tRNA ligase subunit beta [Mycoplasma sp. 744]|uniref:phenylalanine--tRNA ligase subunit beta n=1 Tax=Mycoplasma sp. 744 TaxID=3108531 RepID=UPI002B1E4589|nr:phenylalanine--tRNA ligase subunit beta [Mycoplasma sp. 744]MEA4115708.1 phenylalanine--tRNA ligase subunit beta [Mycoplasma sp. 744]
MLISLKELNKFLPKIKLDLSVETAINNLGYEVESVRSFSDVKGIKFVKILDVYKNPNSKNLNVVKLLSNTGELTIQTVATNAKKDHFAVAFVEGSQKGETVFASKKMANIISQGMLSGFSELGFDSNLLPYDADDLIILDKKSKISLDDDPIEFFELDDYIFDISTPSNRADINSYYVLALELAAYYQTEFKWFNYQTTWNWDFKSKLKVNKNKANALSFLEIKLNNTFTNLKDQLFLAKHNIESKNNWAIDVSNLNLIYNGSPTHSYDLDKLNSTKFNCDFYTGKVKILGNKEVQVNNALTIFNENQAVSLASVIGLDNSAISLTSKNIAFEIGYFDSKQIRKTAKEIKLDTLASNQGAKNINSEMVRMGLNFLAYKAKQDKQKISQFINFPKTRKQQFILQNRHKLAIYANVSVKNLNIFNKVEEQLKQIGFQFNKNRILTPLYRSDLNQYEDIIEEYFRFYGYANFTDKEILVSNINIFDNNNIKSVLKKFGYQEIRTFTLISKEKNLFNPFNFEKDIKLSTFVSLEREMIRNSIVPSLLEVAEYNNKRKINQLNFFEIGMINNNVYVCGILSNTNSFYDLKTQINNLLNDDNLTYEIFNDNDYVHPNVSAKILKNNLLIGWIGKINPKYTNLDCWVAEFRIDLNINNQIQNFIAYNNEPLKVIDLTFTLEKNQSIGKVINELKTINDIFDIQQIDSFYKEKEKLNNVTLRISGTTTAINLLNQKYNN